MFGSLIAYLMMSSHLTINEATIELIPAEHQAVVAG
jgi:hypothetical protein